MPPKARKAATKASKGKWVASVKTYSTRPPEGLFNKDAATIAQTLASKRVSPKGPSSGMRMLTYFINRGGSGLSKEHKATLEKAKQILFRRIKKAKAKRA